METYPNEIAALNRVADSRVTTEVQRNLGQRLTLATTPLRCGERTMRHGVEIPVTTTGVF